MSYYMGAGSQAQALQEEQELFPTEPRLAHCNKLLNLVGKLFNAMGKDLQ